MIATKIVKGEQCNSVRLIWVPGHSGILGEEEENPPEGRLYDPLCESSAINKLQLGIL